MKPVRSCVKIEMWGKVGVAVRDRVDELVMEKVMSGIMRPVWGVVREQNSFQIQGALMSLDQQGDVFDELR